MKPNEFKICEDQRELQEGNMYDTFKITLNRFQEFFEANQNHISELENQLKEKGKKYETLQKEFNALKGCFDANQVLASELEKQSKGKDDIIEDLKKELLAKNELLNYKIEYEMRKKNECPTALELPVPMFGNTSGNTMVYLLKSILIKRSFTKSPKSHSNTV